MTLYHFTRLPWACYICRDGRITPTDPCLDKYAIIQEPQVVWLTERPELGPRDTDHGLCKDKRDFRISVNLPKNKVELWRSFANRHKIERRFYRGMDEAADHTARYFWVHEGEIPLTAVTEILHVPTKRVLTKLEVAGFDVPDDLPCYDAFNGRPYLIFRAGTEVTIMGTLARITGEKALITNVIYDVDAPPGDPYGKIAYQHLWVSRDKAWQGAEPIVAGEVVKLRGIAGVYKNGRHLRGCIERNISAENATRKYGMQIRYRKA